MNLRGRQAILSSGTVPISVEISDLAVPLPQYVLDRADIGSQVLETVLHSPWTDSRVRPRLLVRRRNAQAAVPLVQRLRFVGLRGQLAASLLRACCERSVAASVAT
jgi:hypothetical protein